jgi:hypothetical protein
MIELIEVRYGGKVVTILPELRGRVAWLRASEHSPSVPLWSWLYALWLYSAPVEAWVIMEDGQSIQVSISNEGLTEAGMELFEQVLPHDVRVSFA